MVESNKQISRQSDYIFGELGILLLSDNRFSIASIIAKKILS